jgi:hypothetical protein
MIYSLLYISVVIFMLFLGYIFRISWGRFILLIISPPLLVELFYTIYFMKAVFLIFFVYGMFLMLPALMLYAWSLLVLIQQFGIVSLWGHFIIGAIVGFFSGLIHNVVIKGDLDNESITLALLTMSTGAMSAVMVEYWSRKRAERKAQ